MECNFVGRSILSTFLGTRCALDWSSQDRRASSHAMAPLQTKKEGSQSCDATYPLWGWEH